MKFDRGSKQDGQSWSGSSDGGMTQRPEVAIGLVSVMPTMYTTTRDEDEAPVKHLRISHKHCEGGGEEEEAEGEGGSRRDEEGDKG